MHLKRGKTEQQKRKLTEKNRKVYQIMTVINRGDHSVSQPMNTIRKTAERRKLKEL